MNIRGKLYSASESFLRVPPLLIVDEIFRISFGFGGKIIEYGAKNLVTSGDEGSNSGGLNNNYYLEGFPNSTPAVLNNPFWPYYNHPESQHLSYNKVISDSFSSSSAVSHRLRENVSSTVVGAAGRGLAGSYLSLDPLSALKGLWSAVAATAAGSLQENFTEAAAAAGAGGNTHSDYLFQLNFGDLSPFTENVSWEMIRVGEVLGCLLVFFAAIVMFLLSTETLLKLYSYIGSILSLYLAYMLAPLPLLWSTFSITSLFYNVTLRTVFAGIFFTTRGWSGCQASPTVAPQPSQTAASPPPSKEDDHKKTSYAASTVPIVSFTDALVCALFFSCGLVHFQPLVYLGLILLLQTSLWSCIPKAYAFLRVSWNETRRVQNEYGLSHLLQVESGRLKVNTVFRLFWISRALYDAFFRCCDESVSHVFRYVMSHGTETFTGIVGLTVTVSVICHSIGEFLLYVLYWGTNSETDANRFGSISTVLFFILSLQTGLTSLDPEKRLDRLLKNIVLLGTALFHALHQMVAPLLHAFRTFQGLQIRAASISVAFLSISIYSTVYLLRFSSLSTWSLAVLALAIEFKIKIIISLVISIVVYLSQLVQYPEILQRSSGFLRKFLPRSLNRLVDKLADQLSHEDMVFYLKSFANVAEFLTGIFLFINAVWIFMFESASAIRAIGMTIHAYFNIWCEARKGWKIYSQRKTASMKIMSLSDATEEQLAARKDDVCAICYEEMESAKVTLCGHLFHAVCLRKWLYVQNTCPLCHELLYGEDVLEDMNRAQQAQAAEEDEEDEDDDDDDIFDNYAAYNDTVTESNSAANNNTSSASASSLPPSPTTAALVGAAASSPPSSLSGSSLLTRSASSDSPRSSSATASARDLLRAVSFESQRLNNNSSSNGSTSPLVGTGEASRSATTTPAPVSSPTTSPLPSRHLLAAGPAQLLGGREPLLPLPRNEFLADDNNVVRNNNNNNVNFHPNANARSRGGLAVLL